MEAGFLDYLYEMLNANIYLAATASFIWGVMSIIISPCHLSTIPLVVGFLQSQNVDSYKKAFVLSSIFSLGILLSLIVVGSITYILGRLMGDVGIFGEIFIILIFIVFGLYFLDILKFDWSLFKVKPGKKNGALSALILGFVFGIGLGPCTFAFMAPILGIVFTMSGNSIWIPILYFAAFALGHCLVIVLAGTMSEIVNKYLKWNESTGTISIVKKICGVLMLLAAIYMTYRNFIE